MVKKTLLFFHPHDYKCEWSKCSGAQGDQEWKTAMLKEEEGIPCFGGKQLFELNLTSKAFKDWP